MNKQPLVSIVMSMYNVSEYLREALDSILHQTFKDYELLLVDDGSTDDSTDIAKCYNDQRIRLIANTHDFISSLNKGIDAATGKYVARIGGGNRAGVYQLIDVVPGQTYTFGANVGFRQNNDNQSIKENESLKILSVDGLTLYAYIMIPIDIQEINHEDESTQPHSIAMELTDEVTIPDGVTRVRFQFDQRQYPNPESAPLMLVDECVFVEKPD